MPGDYTHWVTVQATRDNSGLVYHTAQSIWTVVAMASDFEVKEGQHFFMLNELKELDFIIKNNGEEAKGPILTIQINNRFKYIPESAYCVGYENIDPKTERFEGQGLYLEFPDTVVIPTGGELEVRFPVETV